MSCSVGDDILIHSGMHQFQHGRIESIDMHTEIPFAHIILRGKGGQFLQKSGAYVPLKYCIELDEETCQAVAEQRKAKMKAARAALRATLKDQEVRDPIDWEKE